jgi:cytochrome P450
MKASCPMHSVDPFDPAFIADPYPVLAKLRVGAPISYVENLNLWLVTRYDDAKAILLDPATYSNAMTQKPLFPISEEAQQILDAANFMPHPAPVGLTGSDAPIHTRLRKHLARAMAFTPKKIASLEEAVAHSSAELIDAFAHRGHAELVSELTGVLPARVVFKIIGFPEKDHEQLRLWCSDRLTMFWGRSSVAEQCKVADGLAKYWSYCLAFAEAEQGPACLTTELIRVSRDDPNPLSRIEIAGILFGLIFAGQETTANVLTETFRMLLEDRDRWKALMEDRTSIPNAFEETLRLAPPIAAWRRITTKPTTLSGVNLPAGAVVLVHLGSAGHDESTFADSESFDAKRANSTKHFAFGHGVHFCLGAPLSRMEARILINSVMDRIPDIRLRTPQTFEYVPNIAFRGPKQLFVEWGQQ